MMFVPSVNTREFELSHGHKPRGFGTWMFRIGENNLSFSGTYAICRAQAIDKARQLGVSEIFVLP